MHSFLGEQFIGDWNNGEVRLFAEQVSHHPPVTGYHLEGPSITYAGNCAQKTSFSGRTIVVKQVGHGILTVDLADGSKETYLITLPKLKIEGLWFGAPYVELSDTSVIQGSHGLTTTIEYSGKGWVSGKAHSFKATVAKGPHVSTSNAIYVVSGEWTGESHYVKGSPATHEGKLFLNASGPTTPINVKPVEEQNEFESRRAWKAVADGIRKGDFDAASVAKTALENSERQKRKDEAAAGTPFQTRLFTTVHNDPEYHKLAALCKHSPSDEDSYAFKGVSA
uniref:Oxysterol-binding protein n=1 Tax=Leucosporidium scottii TaxID=5278 RepID=A0A0H5FTA6_9BASI|nr:hypothetical protein ls5930a1_00162 [Leucosporidium scottii]CRX79211.1 hypothetical protein ls5931a1_00036 [Leucosporidium scottii]